MKRSVMQIYVKGSSGAVELYLKTFNATLGYNVKNSDGTFYHLELDICGHTLTVARRIMAWMKGLQATQYVRILIGIKV